MKVQSHGRSLKCGPMLSRSSNWVSFLGFLGSPWFSFGSPLVFFGFLWFPLAFLWFSTLVSFTSQNGWFHFRTSGLDKQSNHTFCLPKVSSPPQKKTRREKRARASFSASLETNQQRLPSNKSTRMIPPRSRRTRVSPPRRPSSIAMVSTWSSGTSGTSLENWAARCPIR